MDAAAHGFYTLWFERGCCCRHDLAAAGAIRALLLPSAV
jgi:hypothetical protein